MLTFQLNTVIKQHLLSVDKLPPASSSSDAKNRLLLIPKKNKGHVLVLASIARNRMSRSKTAL